MVDDVTPPMPFSPVQPKTGARNEELKRSRIRDRLEKRRREEGDAGESDGETDADADGAAGDDTPQENADPDRGRSINIRV